MAEHAGVVRVTHFQAALGKRDELIDRLEAGASDIRKVEGCFGAQICSVREMPDVIGAVSRWSSQAALDRWVSASAAQRSELSPLLAAAPMSEHLDALT
jgi:quinol monooxygenase YgiN